MPIIARKIIHVNASDDLTVSIIKEIDSCGCIQSSKLSNDLNIPLLTLKNALRSIGGIKCDKNYEICCTNEDTFNNFVVKLKRLN